MDGKSHKYFLDYELDSLSMPMNMNACKIAWLACIPSLLVACLPLNLWSEGTARLIYRTVSTGDTIGSEAPELLKGSELLPAEENPLGNWGGETNGLQMAAVCYKTNFNLGDPVPVVMLWRN